MENVKSSVDQAVREAQNHLRILDARGDSASLLIMDLEACAPVGACTDAYRAAYEAEIERAKRVCQRAIARASQLVSMAADARLKAERLTLYANQRDTQATNALRVRLSDSRFKP